MKLVSVKLKHGSKEFELTLEEAKELHRQLDVLFDKRPMYWPVITSPVPAPTYPYLPPPYVTCGTSDASSITVIG